MIQIKRFQKNKKTKKSKMNLVPKESKLTSDKIEISNIITQIRSKYHCNIHSKPCYIEDDKHLALILACLYLWAQDIVSIIIN